MNCGKCGGECYDNREQKASGKYKPNAPDFACKDKDCGWKLWPPKEKKQVTGQAQTPRGPKWASWRELAEAYHESLLIARKQVLALELATKKPASLADILSAGATVFIAGTRDGVKKAPVQQPLDEVPAALQESDEETPF